MLPQYIGAFALGLLPSVIWLLFFENEEKERAEPFSDTILAFIVGAGSTFVALLLQLACMRLFSQVPISPHDGIGVSVFAGIEEIIKFLGVYILLSHRPAFREPLAVMIFMVTAALGFAAVENIASLISSGAAATVFASVKSVEIMTLRFLGATLLHCVTTGIVGFHWAIAIVRRRWYALHILAGLALATLLHIGFNYLVITRGPASWALVFVVCIAFFLLIDFEELRTEEERDGLVAPETQ